MHRRPSVSELPGRDTRPARGRRPGPVPGRLPERLSVLPYPLLSRFTSVRIVACVSSLNQRSVMLTRLASVTSVN